MGALNYLYISPEFPENFQNFIIQLNKVGVNVWAISEDEFSNIPEKVRNCIKWFVKTNLYRMIDVENAVKYLIHEHIHAPIDVVASHNEHWLRVEAFINEKFNISGVNLKTIDILKRKSEMKRIFMENDIKVAAGKIVRSLKEAKDFANSHKYPFILKPDEGVGAAGVYKINKESELSAIWPRLTCDYIMEEFLAGEMLTYDGIADWDGKIIFDNSAFYGSPVMEYVQGKDAFFYTVREIPQELRDLGQKIVTAFNLKRQFFHFEFFKNDQGYIPVEINSRPPGGPLVDMMNYSIDDDLYKAYARMIIREEPKVKTKKKYFTAYFGRKNRNYLYSHENIMERYGNKIMIFYTNPSLYWQALGQYVYLFRSPEEKIIDEIRDALAETTYPN